MRNYGTGLCATLLIGLCAPAAAETLYVYGPGGPAPAIRKPAMR